MKPVIKRVLSYIVVALGTVLIAVVISTAQQKEVQHGQLRRFCMGADIRIVRMTEGCEPYVWNDGKD